METKEDGCLLDHLSAQERVELEQALTRMLDVMVTPEPAFVPRTAA